MSLAVQFLCSRLAESDSCRLRPLPGIPPPAESYSQDPPSEVSLAHDPPSTALPLRDLLLSQVPIACQDLPSEVLVETGRQNTAVETSQPADAAPKVEGPKRKRSASFKENDDGAENQPSGGEHEGSSKKLKTTDSESGE